MLREALMRLSQQKQLKAIATQNGLARTLARRFVAGETLDEAIDVVRGINSQHMTASLDPLGENVSTRAEAIDGTRAAVEAVQTIVRANISCNLSVKLTQLGLDLDPAFAQSNLARIVEEAAAHDLFIRIDMESSAYVDRTLEIFFRLFEHSKNLGVVIQSCLYRSAEDVETLIGAGARVRLVKGAYLEPPDVAFQHKVDVDANFERLTALLLTRGTYPAIATHDVRMIETAKGIARERGITADRFEFQMLFGVRRDLQHQLVDEGYGMRVYVPYGSHWYPYLMRRMAERPANVMFVLSNIAREASARR